MQETFIVTVQTEDGRWSTQEKINGDWLTLSFLLSQLSQRFLLHSKVSQRLETLPGSGIGQSVPDSSSPTPS